MRSPIEFYIDFLENYQVEYQIYSHPAIGLVGSVGEVRNIRGENSDMISLLEMMCDVASNRYPISERMLK